MLAKIIASSGSSLTLNTAVTHILPGAGAGLSNLDLFYENIDGITTKIMKGAFYNVVFHNLQLTGNYITLEDNAFIYCTFEVLRLGSTTYGVNHLTRNAFMNCSFTKTAYDVIAFGTSVHEIDDYAFANLAECPRELYFGEHGEGTISDWNSITKGSNWNSTDGGGTVFDVIHCADGDINL